MSYAFKDFHDLVFPISASRNPVIRDPVIIYLCALVAELAYHHVPKFEIDDQKRAKVIPCEGHNLIVNGGRSNNVVQYIVGGEENSFVIEDRGVIAVGIWANESLFIGFRGTVFLYDWKINLRASLVELGSNLSHCPILLDSFRRDDPESGYLAGCIVGRVHGGFAEEAFRISTRVLDKVRSRKKVKHIFLSGHSLGGAVAGIAQHFLWQEGKRISTCIFGSPRYCDVSAYCSSLHWPPTQIQRPGDIVPSVPPRRMGYADHPYPFDTKGNPIFEPIRNPEHHHFLWRAALFFAKGLKPHSMELYRKELGCSAKAEWWNKPLTSHEKLK